LHEAAVTALGLGHGRGDGRRPDVPDRTGNRHPALAMAPYNTYSCSDGYVAIFTAAERHWQSIVRLLGRPDLATGSDYASTVARAKNMREIDDIVGAWTIGRSKDEVLRLLNEAHVPCAPVQDGAQVACDPHLEARGFWVDIDHPRAAARACRSRPSDCIRRQAGDPQPRADAGPAHRGGAVGDAWAEGGRARQAARVGCHQPVT